MAWPGYWRWRGIGPAGGGDRIAPTGTSSRPPARPPTARHNRTYLLEAVFQALDVFSLACAIRARHQVWPVSPSVGQSVSQLGSQSVSQSTTHSLGEDPSTRPGPPSSIRERAAGRQEVGQGAPLPPRPEDLGRRADARLAMVVQAPPPPKERKDDQHHARTHTRTHAARALPCQGGQPRQGERTHTRTGGGTKRAWAGGSCRAGGREGGQEGD